MISKNEIECLESCLCDIINNHFLRLTKEAKSDIDKEYLENKQKLLMDSIFRICDGMRVDSKCYEPENDIMEATKDFINELKDIAYKQNARNDLKNILKGSKGSKD
ncbi:hypothetical protein DCO58_02170 [Helicobacter saguini]|nr:hypothetical protein [Helicobacter saguini]MWV66513.1 hypothetical protein [Helicobacter saguini]MWV68862.1 hypothetical protein [Helicobacter saguini]